MMAVFLTKRKLHFPISIFSMLELSDELSTYFRPSSVCIPRADRHDNDVTAHKSLCTPLREIGSGDDLEEDRQSGFFSELWSSTTAVYQPAGHYTRLG